MTVQFKLLADGGFVAGDSESGMTSYAYPSSPHAVAAKKHAELVAEEMLASERADYRAIPAIREYDRRNWERINNA